MNILHVLEKWLDSTPTHKDRYREIITKTIKSPQALHRQLTNRRWKINGSIHPESLEYVYSWIRR